jgi:hypothetical protein
MRLVFLLLCFSLFAVGCGVNDDQLKDYGLMMLSKNYGKEFEVKSSEVKYNFTDDSTVWEAVAYAKDSPEAQFNLTVRKSGDSNPKIDYENYLKELWTFQAKKEIVPKVFHGPDGQDLVSGVSAYVSVHKGKKKNFPNGKIPDIKEMLINNGTWPEVNVIVFLKDPLQVFDIPSVSSVLWLIKQKLKENNLSNVKIVLSLDGKEQYFEKRGSEITNISEIENELRNVVK